MVILLARGRGQPCAAWREHHWIVNPFPGDKRQTNRASEGDRSQALPRGRFRDFDQPGSAQALREIELAAKALGVKLQYFDVLGPKDIGPALRAAARNGLTQSLYCGGPCPCVHRKQIPNSR